MGVQGVGIMEDEAKPNPIGPTPWRFFGDFLGVQKVTRRPQAAKLPLQETKPLCHRPLIRLAFGQPPSPQGEGLGVEQRAKSPRIP